MKSRFTHIIYSRLFQLAFFIQRFVEKDGWEQQTVIDLSFKFAVRECVKDKVTKKKTDKVTEIEEKVISATVAELKAFLVLEKIYCNLQREMLWNPEAPLEGKKLSADELQSASYNLFRTDKRTQEFLNKFQYIHDLYMIGQCLDELQKRHKFLQTFQMDQYNQFQHTLYPKNSDLLFLISHLSNALQRYIDPEDKSEKWNLLEAIMEYCMDFRSHQNQVPPKYKISDTEKQRRKNISKTKLIKTQKRRNKIKAIIEKLKHEETQELQRQEQARSEKARGKAVKIIKAKTAKARCQKYFKQHPDTMKKLGIGSYRTLLNHYINSKPNAQRHSYNAMNSLKSIKDLSLLKFSEETWESEKDKSVFYSCE